MKNVGQCKLFFRNPLNEMFNFCKEKEVNPYNNSFYDYIRRVDASYENSNFVLRFLFSYIKPLLIVGIKKTSRFCRFTTTFV